MRNNQNLSNKHITWKIDISKEIRMLVKRIKTRISRPRFKFTHYYEYTSGSQSILLRDRGLYLSVRGRPRNRKVEGVAKTLFLL